MENLELASLKSLREAFRKNTNESFFCGLVSSEADKETIKLLFNNKLRDSFLKLYKNKPNFNGGEVFLFHSKNAKLARQIRLDYLDFIIASLEKRG